MNRRDLLKAAAAALVLPFIPGARLEDWDGSEITLGTDEGEIRLAVWKCVWHEPGTWHAVASRIDEGGVLGKPELVTVTLPMPALSHRLPASVDMGRKSVRLVSVSGRAESVGHIRGLGTVACR